MKRSWLCAGVGVLLCGTVAMADDMGWLQPGVRVWYAGISADYGSTSDAEEAYLIESIQNGAARVVKHAAINFWTNPLPVETFTNPDPASDGEFWISPARLRAMRVLDDVSWRGLACMVKAKPTWGLEDDRMMHLLPIVALFQLKPQRDIVVLMTDQGVLAEYYFDVETGLLLYMTRNVPGYTQHLTLSEINYNFATHQAHPEDNGPHTHYAATYNALDMATGQTFHLLPIYVSRYGSKLLMRHSGMFMGGAVPGYLSFDGLARYDMATDQCVYNPDYTFFSENWSQQGDHFFAWIPPAHLFRDSITLQHSTLFREGAQTLAATQSAGTTFSTAVRPHDFDVVAAVYDAAGFATDIAIASLDYQFHVDTRAPGLGFRDVHVDGPQYYAENMTPALPGDVNPHFLTAIALAGNKIKIQWECNAVFATGFTLQRKTSPDGTWSVRATLAASARSYTDSNLTTGNTYYYRVRAATPTGDTPLSNVSSATVVTSSSPPTAPSHLVATWNSETAVQLSWTDHAGTEAGFEVFRWDAPGNMWVRIATTGANIAGYVDEALMSADEPAYYVKAYNPTGASAPSNTATAVMPTSPPNPPGALTVSIAEVKGALVLSWVDNADNETAFNIERATSPGGPFAVLTSVAANVTSHTDTGLVACTTYYYRVNASNLLGLSAYSNVGSARSACPPTAPTGFTASAIADDTIVLRWTDTSDDENGFKIKRATSLSGPWRTLTTTQANMIEHTDTGLQGSRMYYYKLQAYNAAGTSAWIGPVTAKTQKTGTPDAPGDLSATIVSPSQVDLAWTDHADDETQFLVQRRLSGSTTWSTIAIVDANVTSHTDATVEGGKTYEYRVKAKNAVGASKPTQVVVVTTAVGLAHLQR